MRYFLMVFFFFSVLFADDEPKVLIVPSNQVIDKDYFACGKVVEISGVIKGDLYAAAGELIIDGVIEGDVIAVAGSSEIAGEVMGNVRLIAGQLTLTGKIGKNCSMIVGSSLLLPPSIIGGSLVSIAGTLALNGQIEEEAIVIASSAKISGTIGKQVDAFTGALRLTSRARVGGKLEYTSGVPAIVEEGALITGGLVHHLSLVRKVVQSNFLQKILFGSKLLALLMNFIYSFVLGYVLYRAFPDTLTKSFAVLKSRPGKAFACGCLTLILLPVASLILLMTILGVPFALTLMAFNILTFYTAKIITVFWLSHQAREKWAKRMGPMLLFGIFLFIYFLLTEIPYIGILIAFVATLLGLGATLLSKRKYGL